MNKQVSKPTKIISEEAWKFNIEPEELNSGDPYIKSVKIEGNVKNTGSHLKFVKLCRSSAVKQSE